MFYYVKRSKEIYREHGAMELTNRVVRKVSTRLFETGILDPLAFRLSVRKLEKRKALESDIDDVLRTIYGYKGKGRYTNIAPIQHRDELRAFVKRVEEHSPETMLEIGTARGGSLYLFCRYLDSTEQIISLDIGEAGIQEYYSDRLHLYERFTRDSDIEFIIGNSRSQETIDEVRAISSEIDFLFIDGDHRYEAVRADFENYKPLMADDGLIAFHDISNPRWKKDVGRLWDEIKDDYETEIFNSPSTGKYNTSLEKDLGIGIVYL